MNASLNINEEISLFGKHTIYLRSVTHYSGVARRNYPYHYHNYYEMSFAIHGKNLFMVNGKEFLCGAGQAVLVTPGCLHSVSIDSVEERDSIWTFRFQIDPNSELAQKLGLCAYVIPLDKKAEFLNALLLQWVELERQSPHASYYIHPCALLLLQLVFEALEREAVIYEDLSDDYCRRILQHLMKHYLDDFSLDDLSSRFYISKSHLMRRFKQNFGISPIRYRNELLINESCYYLVETDMNNRDISDLLGFDNTSIFLRSFKNFMKMTPSDYRKHFREKPPSSRSNASPLGKQEHLGFLYPL